MSDEAILKPEDGKRKEIASPSARNDGKRHF
jgi:hypothetical protein